MYFNLIIGVVVLGVLVFLGRSLMRRMRSPSSILQEELDQRRKRNEQVQENLQRVRERARERMGPVRRAINEMNASLLVAQRFTVEEGDDCVHVRQEGTVISVTYQLASFSLDGSVSELQADMAQYERYFIEVRNEAQNKYQSREAVTHEEAIRLVAREIAALLQQ